MHFCFWAGSGERSAQLLVSQLLSVQDHPAQCVTAHSQLDYLVLVTLESCFTVVRMYAPHFEHHQSQLCPTSYCKVTGSLADL